MAEKILSLLPVICTFCLFVNKKGKKSYSDLFILSYRKQKGFVIPDSAEFAKFINKMVYRAVNPALQSPA